MSYGHTIYAEKEDVLMAASSGSAVSMARAGLTCWRMVDPAAKKTG